MINTFNEGNKQNPVTMANDIKMKKILNRTIANSYVQYNILDDLIFKVTAGFDNYAMEDKQFYPTTTPRGYLYNGQACMANISSFGWLNESLGYNNLSLAKDFHSYSNTSKGAMLSFIFRGNYAYDDRYIGTFTFRRDGTSSFLKNKWGSFFSGALAWNAKQEEFLKYNNAISTLKLRASVGEVGNSNVPTSGSFAQLYTTSTAFGTDLSIGQSPVTLANENLTWEKTLEYNLGNSH